MSKTLSDIEATLFDSEVHHAWQEPGGTIMNTVRNKTITKARDLWFPKMSEAIATPRIPGTRVVAADVVHTRVLVALADWNCGEYTDIFDESHVPIDERQELAFTLGAGARRRGDQVIMDVMTAASGTGTVANSVGGSLTNMNVAKARRAKRIMDTKNVPKSDRFMLIHANGLESMLAETEVNSSDFNSVKALVNGELNTFLGFEWITLGDITEGGLSIDGSLDRINLAYHRRSTGFAKGIDFRSEVNYIPQETQWLANVLFSVGSVVIDANGIVQITCREVA